MISTPARGPFYTPGDTADTQGPPAPYDSHPSVFYHGASTAYTQKNAWYELSAITNMWIWTSLHSV
jgi:hypothetical protein